MLKKKEKYYSFVYNKPFLLCTFAAGFGYLLNQI